MTTTLNNRSARRAAKSTKVVGTLLTSKPKAVREPKPLDVQADKGVSLDLATARRDYLSAVGGKSIKGGGPWVGMCPKGLEVIDPKLIASIDDLADALSKISTKKAMAWGGAKVAELDKAAVSKGKAQSDGAHFAQVAFCQFVQDGGYTKLAKALKVITKHRARCMSERIAGVKYTFDVLVDLQNMFGLRLTFSRRARHGFLVK